MAAEGNIKVYCRVRPLLPTERDGGDKAGFLEVKEGATVVANQPLNGVASSGGVYKRLNFDFDDVFDTETTQEEVFDRAARSVVEGVMDGYHGTIFAYGQSGSGKTHTMQGPDLARLSDHGIGPRSVYELFRLIEEAPESCRFTVRISCVEIYMERVRDLLDLRGNNLSIRQDPTKGVFVSGAREEYVASPEEMLSLVAQSAANRVVSATGLNTDSSRSHAVTTVTVEIRDEAEGAMRVGKLSLVDLAGSEMVRKTLATGLNLEEAKIINKSLSALGNVIKALAGSSSRAAAASRRRARRETDAASVGRAGALSASDHIDDAASEASTARRPASAAARGADVRNSLASSQRAQLTGRSPSGASSTSGAGSVHRARAGLGGAVAGMTVSGWVDDDDDDVEVDVDAELGGSGAPLRPTPARAASAGRSAPRLPAAVGAGGGGGSRPASRASVGSAAAASESGRRRGRSGSAVGRRRGSISSIGSLASTVGTSAHSAVGGSGSGPRHVPYRDSKLTRLLQDSLGGNCRTALIICASDNARHGNETLSTLRFGARASRVQNHAVVNRLRTAEEMAAQLVKAEAAIDAQAALIQQLKAQLVRVTRLAAKLNQMRLTGTGRGSAESEAALQEGSVISAGSPAQQSALPLTLGPAVMPQLEGSGRIGSGDSEPGPADAPTEANRRVMELTVQLNSTRAELESTRDESRSLGEALASKEEASVALRARLDKTERGLRRCTKRLRRAVEAAAEAKAAAAAAAAGSSGERELSRRARAEAERLAKTLLRSAVRKAFEGLPGKVLSLQDARLAIETLAFEAAEAARDAEAAREEAAQAKAGAEAAEAAASADRVALEADAVEARVARAEAEAEAARAPTDKARLDATASRALAVANDAEYAGSAAADVAAVRSAGRHLRRARAEVAAATLRAADDARDSPILPDADSQAALAAAQAELGAVFARLETSSAEHPAVAASIESVLRPVAAATNAALPWSALPAAGASTAVALQAAWAHLPSGPQRAATGSPTALPEAGPGPGSQGAGGDTATSGDMAELLALLRDHAEALGTSALRLSSLTAVNRQLARKFAVADSELSGLTGAIRARDRRIAALVAELRDALGRASRAEEAAATARSGRAGVSPYDGLSESDADTDASAATSRRGGLSRRPRATSSSRERHVRFAGQAPSMRPTLAHDGHVIVPLAGGRTPRSPADVGAGLSPQRTSDVAREASFLGRSRVWPGRLGDDDDAEAEAEDERAASDVGAPAVARAGAAGRGAGGHRPQAWYSAGEPAAPAGARPASPVDAGSMSDGSVMSDADGAVWTGVIVKPDTGAPPAASGWIDEDSD
ncbi:hypothetical protein FNF31_01000 [Cafeteria roenbergensis]|uniref:Kinesin motor domain-containing protein n=2 Tax=Cafeteria roenbergensis TaxID=33653 RepID=A0A5A8DQS7_CAFRO|nr:hypothetical protein FNF31_01000 [Cafeteria roenbergensis]